MFSGAEWCKRWGWQYNFQRDTIHGSRANTCREVLVIFHGDAPSPTPHSPMFKGSSPPSDEEDYMRRHFMLHNCISCCDFLIGSAFKLHSLSLASHCLLHYFHNRSIHDRKHGIEADSSKVSLSSFVLSESDKETVVTKTKEEKPCVLEEEHIPAYLGDYSI